MNEDDVATNIFAGINRCWYFFTKRRAMDDPIPDNLAFYLPGVSLPRFRELSFIRHPLIRELIFLLGDDNSWRSYKRKSIGYYALIQDSKKEEDQHLKYQTKKHEFNDEIINILTPGESLEEQSILLRVVFILMGVNPYKNLSKDNLDQIYRTVRFEMRKLLAAFRLLEQIDEYKTGHDSGDYWTITADYIERVIDRAVHLVDCTFLIWSYSLGQTIPKLHHDHWDCYNYPSDRITEEQLVSIWGGSSKAFKNEHNRKKSQAAAIIKFVSHRLNFTVEEVLEGGPAKIEIEMDSAIEWLDTKSINTTFLDQPKVSDYNFKAVEQILHLPSLKSAKSQIKTYLSDIKNFEDNDTD